MKYVIKIEHELLSGHLVCWNDDSENLKFRQKDGILVVFESASIIEDHLGIDSSEYELLDLVIDDCLKELSRSHHKVSLTARNHFLEVRNILDDLALDLGQLFRFRDEEPTLDLLNDYIEFGVDEERYKLISGLVEGINLFIMALSKDYFLVEQD